MSLRGELRAAAGVRPGEISAESVLDEFLTVMHEWRHQPFRCPGSVPPEEQVLLPGPEDLEDCAADARAWLEMLDSGHG